MTLPPGSADEAVKPLARTTLLVAGPESPLTCDIARVAAERGALAAIASSQPCADVAANALARFHFDHHSETAADQLIDAVAARFDALDVVVITIAAGPLSSLHELSLESWQNAVTAPLRRVFWLTRRTIEHCLAEGRGVRFVLVLDTSSGDARNEVIEEALASFARSVAREYGRRAITCNVVSSAGASQHDAASRQRLRDDVVEHVLFLASPDASFVNGETLLVEPETS